MWIKLMIKGEPPPAVVYGKAEKGLCKISLDFENIESISPATHIAVVEKLGDIADLLTKDKNENQ